MMTNERWINKRSGELWFGRVMKVKNQEVLYVTKNLRREPRRRVRIENYRKLGIGEIAERRPDERIRFNYVVAIVIHNFRPRIWDIRVRREGTKTWKVVHNSPREVMRWVRGLDNWRLARRRRKRNMIPGGKVFLFKVTSNKRSLEF